MDRTRYSSYSRAIMTAINEVKDTIRESLQSSGAGLSGLATLLQIVQPARQRDETMSEEAFDTAMDFINGL